MEELDIDNINKHVYALTRYLYEQLAALHHRWACGGGVSRSNGRPLVEIYGKHHANNKDVQGGIISLNFLHSDGSYIGYYEIQTDSAKQNIHIRTGCHCNPGACRKYLNESDEVLKKWG